MTVKTHGVSRSVHLSHLRPFRRSVKEGLPSIRVLLNVSQSTQNVYLQVTNCVSAHLRLLILLARSIRAELSGLTVIYLVGSRSVTYIFRHAGLVLTTNDPKDWELRFLFGGVVHRSRSTVVFGGSSSFVVFAPGLTTFSDLTNPVLSPTEVWSILPSARPLFFPPYYSVVTLCSSQRYLTGIPLVAVLGPFDFSRQLTDFSSTASVYGPCSFGQFAGILLHSSTGWTVVLQTVHSPVSSATIGSSGRTYSGYSVR